jgi:hypothetical protein
MKPFKKLNKKAQSESFDLGNKMGYYIIAIIIIIVLFIFLMILATGINDKYYKNTYGTNVLNFEERAFNCINYIDPFTGIKYSKVIDESKLTNNVTFSNCMGLYSEEENKGVKLTVYDKNNEVNGSLKTINYIDRPDFSKVYPILIKDTNGYKAGKINISFWKI